jgi:hypothetical protein
METIRMIAQKANVRAGRVHWELSSLRGFLLLPERFFGDNVFFP